MKGEMMDLWGWDIDFEINREAYLDLIRKNFWIPKDQCIIGGVYLCKARNFSLGVFNGTGFDYNRKKFGSVFPDVEFHWDDGPPYGTVKPFLLIKDLGR